jgi:NadR type nicotinamide-nucleotide adenylyltransferase
VTSVVLVGAESSGKSTLAEALAKEYNTVWMPEYGRVYWLEHQSGRQLTVGQLSEIAVGHAEREEALWKQSNKYLFVDTGAVTTAVFSRYYHGETSHIIESPLASNSITRYDLHVLCDIDIPYADTWDREGAEQRKIFQKMIEKDLIRRRIPFVRLSGTTLEERISKVKLILRKFNKHKSVMENLGGLTNA